MKKYTDDYILAIRVLRNKGRSVDEVYRQFNVKKPITKEYFKQIWNDQTRETIQPTGFVSEMKKKEIKEKKTNKKPSKRIMKFLKKLGI
jgi:hypothetical protein